jgi:SAM-dependent methyltransferase
MTQTNTGADTDHSGSPDRFGYEWAEYTELRPVYEEQFKRWTALIKPEEWRGLRFIDVGCGMGRNSHWPMTYGASGGVSIDVDDRSLASARRTLADWPNVEIRKMSGYEIAFDGAFDIAFSIGVIHHLARPLDALKQMVKAVKPGGRVMIWVYGYENNEWIVRYFDPLRKLLFARLPIGLTHFLSLFPTVLLWLLLRLGFGRLEYFNLLRRTTFRQLRSIVFDQMLPRIANYWKREEVERLLRDAGLTDVRVAPVNDMSWTAVGTRPAASP